MRPIRSWARALMLVPLLLGTPGALVGVAQAAPLEGEYLISFTGNEALWPLQSLDDCETDVIDGIEVEVCVRVAFARDGKGRVAGSGTFDFTALGIGVDISGTLAGTVKGTVKGTDRKGLTQTVSLKFKGAVSVEGVGSSLPAKMSGKLKTTISTGGLQETKGKLKVTVQKHGTTKVKLETGLEEIPMGAGDWVLALEITSSTDNTKLSGTARLELPDGEQFLSLEGSYKPKSDKANISATGKNSTKGIELDLKGVRSSDPGLFEAGSVSFDVQGITGKKSLKVRND